MHLTLSRLKNRGSYLRELWLLGGDRRHFQDVEGREVLRFCRLATNGPWEEYVTLRNQLAQEMTSKASLRDRLVRAFNARDSIVTLAVGEAWIESWFRSHLENRTPHRDEIHPNSSLLLPRGRRAVIDALCQGMAGCGAVTDELPGHQEARLSTSALCARLLTDFARYDQSELVRSYALFKARQFKIPVVGASGAPR